MAMTSTVLKKHLKQVLGMNVAKDAMNTLLAPSTTDVHIGPGSKQDLLMTGLIGISAYLKLPDET
jgi:hypothetical protein